MSNTAVILGGAECLWRDVDALRELVDVNACTIIAVNDAGFEWPGRIDHWVTGHPEELAYRMERRTANGYPDGFETWTRVFPFGMKDREDICDHVLGERWMHGSSSLLAVGAAHETGHGRAVLCGVPMDKRGHFNRSKPWGGYGSYRAAWEESGDDLAWVRSMSGWTAELLGRPTVEWLSRTARLTTGARKA